MDLFQIQIDILKNYIPMQVNTTMKKKKKIEFLLCHI